MILCTCASYNPEPEFVKYTTELMKQYCAKHDIQFFRKDELKYKNSHPVWNKLPLILECFQKADDWIIWMDADAAPINMDFSIKNYLNSQQKKIIIAKDKNNFNAGVFAIPVNDRAKQFIEYIEKQTFNPKYANVGWRQQQVMIDLFNSTYDNFYKLPPNQIGFNNYPYADLNGVANYFQDDKHWCLHMPATFLYDRNTKFKKYFENLKK